MRPSSQSPRTPSRLSDFCIVIRAQWKVRSLLSVITFGVVLMLGIAATSSAQTFTVLHVFTGADGLGPYAGLVQDRFGNLYGTTIAGGTDWAGVVFEVNAAGTETVLHNFTGYDGTGDGATPGSALLQDKAGNLYGTTFYGGVSGAGCGGSCGTVFKVDTSGTETVLYSFAGGTADGCNPWGGLTQDDVGNLYGTTSFCGSAGLGTAWELDKDGKETILHSFAGADGAYPNYGNLLMDKKGNLYGVTKQGGSANEGVVYKLTKSGALTVLHSFTGPATPDGCLPVGTLVMDPEGSLYGATGACGALGYGTVWKLDKNREETILHAFNWSASDGAFPFGGVIRDSQGNLYGSTGRGGPGEGDGTVYKLSRSGTFTLLHAFSLADGYYPQGELLRDAKGGLYGTCDLGGQNGGTVWSLK
jgi:uncharacterized repeat protein (TIGR03803 family)